MYLPFQSYALLQCEHPISINMSPFQTASPVLADTGSKTDLSTTTPKLICPRFMSVPAKLGTNWTPWTDFSVPLVSYPSPTGTLKWERYPEMGTKYGLTTQPHSQSLQLVVINSASTRNYDYQIPNWGFNGERCTHIVIHLVHFTMKVSTVMEWYL